MSRDIPGVEVTKLCDLLDGKNGESKNCVACDFLLWDGIQNSNCVRTEVRCGALQTHYSCPETLGQT